MQIMTGWRRALSWSGIVSFLLVAAVWPSAATFAGVPAADATGRAAKASLGASSALFLAVARAGERLVAVGERGFVLLSDDGGRTWRQARAVPVSVTLTNVRFVSDQLGWAVGHGGVVLHSRDGGQTWVRQLDGVQAAARILDDAKAGAARGDEASKGLLREAERLVADGPDKPLLGMHFEDERRGWVVGAYGLALATDDGGRTWHSMMARIDNPTGKHLYDIRPHAEGLVIAGEQGALFRSGEQDRHFAALSTPYPGTFFGTLSGVAGEFIAYGLRGNAYRRLGAADWEKIELGSDVTVTAAARLSDSSLVLADATGRLLRSKDGGAHFAVLPTAQGRSITGLAQAADGALILAGARGLTRVEPDLFASESTQ